MLYLLFGFSLVLLIILIVTAAYLTLLKKEEEEENLPNINTSGAFSIVRKSPRDSLQVREMTLERITEVIKPHIMEEDGGKTASRYFDLWNQTMEKNISAIENGDKEGIQTYGYTVPETENEVCKTFAGGSTYVTREQIQNFPSIIPPFHLGCRVKLAPKFAWNTNLDGTGWKPLVPANGEYPTPDWRTIGNLD